MLHHQSSRKSLASDGSGYVIPPVVPFTPRENWQDPVPHPGILDLDTASRHAKTDLTAFISRQLRPVVDSARLQLAAARSAPLRRQSAVDFSKLREYRTSDHGGRVHVLVTDAPPLLPAVQRGQDLTPEEVQTRHARQDSRRLKYRLQRTAARLRPSERVALCHRLVHNSAAGVRVLRSQDGRAHLDGVQTCGSVWMCPVCAAKITEKRRQELQTMIDAHRANGGQLLFLTLTIPHQRHDVLTAPALRKTQRVRHVEISRDTGEIIQECGYEIVCPLTGELIERGGRRSKRVPTGEVVEFVTEHIDRVNGGRLVPGAGGDLVFEASGIVPRLTSAYRRFMSGRAALSQLLNGDDGRADYVGSVRALEVTHGRNNGFHPHLHTLILVNRDLTDTELTRLERRLFVHWSRSVAAEGLGQISRHGLRLERPRVAGDVDPITQYLIKWGAAEELSKLHTKGANAVPDPKKGASPWQLLAAAADGDLRAGAIWQEYATAFKGRRQLVYSHGLREKFGLGKEKTDEELADAPADEREQYELVYQIERPEWIAVRACGDRATLLDLAEYGRVQVAAYIAECLKQFEDQYGPLGVVRREDSILEAASWSETG